MKVETYLSFEGQCEEALEYYKQVLGAEVTMLMRNEESPEPQPPGLMPAGSGRKIMHSAMRIGDTNVMASDGYCTGKSSFGGFSLALSVKDKADAERKFAALSEGGEVRMPLTATFFSPAFGIVADRFGVSWMVLVDA